VPVIARSVTDKGVGKMTTLERTILLSLVGTLLGASAALVLASPAVASELLTGQYIVSQSTSVPAAVNIAVRTTKDGQNSTQTVRCWLPKGVDSQVCRSHQLDLDLSVSLVEENDMVGRIEIDFVPLEMYAVDHGYEVVDIVPAQPDLQAAEAWFNWWTSLWECSVSQADIDTCNGLCGWLGGDVSATPLISSNYATAEPSCEVSCDCNDPDAEDDSWIDPPQVLPG
jgi:hypothetical protein